jgi:hypothetical protein
VRSHWNIPVPLPRLDAPEAFGQIERDHHPDQAGAHALEQAAEDQVAVAVGEGDHWNAGHEEDTAGDHEPLAAHPVGKHAGEEGRYDASQEDRGDDEGELARVQAGGGLEVGEGPRDDPDVNAVEEAAQARDEQQEDVVARSWRSWPSGRGRS